MTKKILIGKTDTLASVIKKIAGVEEDEIILILPKNSLFGQSADNFRLLKKEAEAARKELVVESVDEAVLETAQKAKLRAAHPLFEGGRRGPVLSDIVPRPKGGAAPEPARGLKPKSTPKPAAPLPKKFPFKEEKIVERHFREVGVIREEKPSVRRPRRRVRKPVVIAVSAVAVLLVLLWGVAVVFGKATVVIELQKKPWNYSGTIFASTDVQSVDPEKNTLPAELFTADKNATQFFPASGSSNVSQKATGEITVYNAYSSAPQTFVATTRFATLDGKVFRLANQVVVPGAQVAAGQITPSHIDARVTADAPGANYNVGPVAKLTIPGLKGTPKYGGFYGELKDGTSGGFIGQKAVPTSGDVQSAKEKIAQFVEAALQNNSILVIPLDFKILDGASDTEIVRTSVNTTTDENGNFSVFGDGHMRALGFRNADLSNLLTSLANKNNSNTVFSAPADLSFVGVKADFDRGLESFTVSASGTLQSAFSADTFKSQIAGKDISAVQSAIAGLPGLFGAKISLWPFWLKSLPANAAKISIVVE